MSPAFIGVWQFVSKYISTIGIDYGVKPVTVNGESVRVNFWDLSGHPDFFEIRNEFYKDSQGVRQQKTCESVLFLQTWREPIVDRVIAARLCSYGDVGVLAIYLNRTRRLGVTTLIRILRCTRTEGEILMQYIWQYRKTRAFVECQPF